MSQDQWNEETSRLVCEDCGRNWQHCCFSMSRLGYKYRQEVFQWTWNEIFQCDFVLFHFFGYLSNAFKCYNYDDCDTSESEESGTLVVFGTTVENIYFLKMWPSSLQRFFFFSHLIQVQGQLISGSHTAFSALLFCEVQKSQSFWPVFQTLNQDTNICSVGKKDPQTVLLICCLCTKPGVQNDTGH